MFNTHDISRDACQLFGAQARTGYDWWWHSFTGIHEKTGEERSFFVEFYLCDPALGENIPILGQLPENRAAGKRPSYLMVKCGAWGENALQLHRFFGIKTVSVDMGVPFSVRAEDCFLSETQMHGSVRVAPEDAENHPEWLCDAGEMTFDLTIEKQVAFNVGYGASAPMRRLQLFEMFWHAEGMKTAFSGSVTVNGERYRVEPDNCFGYADKNWGRDFTSPWVWLSSNDLVSLRTGKRLRDSVFDIGGGRPKIGPVALPRQLLSAFWYEGTPYEFNFSKFWTGCKTAFDCRETDSQIVWHVDQSASGSRMVTDIVCDKKDMLLVRYEAPDGIMRHNRLWNGGNGRGTVRLYRKGRLIDEIAAGHVGCEYGEYC